MKLNTSAITFNAADHTYTTPDGKLLSGITKLIRERKFPDMHEGISEKVLEAAAERGHQVHALCQWEDELSVPAESENEQYARASNTYTLLRTKQGYKPIANEYTVSDNEKYASNIDCVWSDDDKSVLLVDIKTTYNLNEEYVAWQLSVYAFFFEMLNPGIPVKGIAAVWLPFRKDRFADELAKAVTLKRKGVEDVKKLLYEEPGTEMVVAKEVPLALVTEEVIETYVATIANIAKLEAIKNDFQDSLKSAMLKYDKPEWETDRIRAKVTPEGTRKSFDTKAFAKDYPDLYAKYMKEGNVKAKITITIRNNNQ